MNQSEVRAVLAGCMNQSEVRAVLAGCMNQLEVRAVLAGFGETDVQPHSVKPNIALI